MLTAHAMLQIIINFKPTLIVHRFMGALLWWRKRKTSNGESDAFFFSGRILSCHFIGAFMAYQTIFLLIAYTEYLAGLVKDLLGPQGAFVEQITGFTQRRTIAVRCRVAQMGMC